MTLKGKTLYQKIHNVKKADWGMNTNLKAAFDKVLDIALKGNVHKKKCQNLLLSFQIWK